MSSPEDYGDIPLGRQSTFSRAICDKFPKHVERWDRTRVNAEWMLRQRHPSPFSNYQLVELLAIAMPECNIKLSRGCHLVSLGDHKQPPAFCQRNEQTDIVCTCCSQCCTCGG